MTRKRDPEGKGTHFQNFMFSGSSAAALQATCMPTGLRQRDGLTSDAQPSSDPVRFAFPDVRLLPDDPVKAVKGEKSRRVRDRGGRRRRGPESPKGRFDGISATERRTKEPLDLEGAAQGPWLCEAEIDGPLAMLKRHWKTPANVSATRTGRPAVTRPEHRPTSAAAENESRGRQLERSGRRGCRPAITRRPSRSGSRYGSTRGRARPVAGRRGGSANSKRARRARIRP